MASEAMNREELIEFVRDNFSIDEVWDSWEVLNWARENLDISDLDWETKAEDEGWINPFDGDVLSDTQLKSLAINSGVIDPYFNIEAYHDDNRHPGAIAYCQDPVCSNYPWGWGAF